VTVSFFFITLLIALVALGGKPAIGDEHPVNNPSSVRNADIIDAIGACASRGQEAVLSATANPDCVPYGAGSRLLERQSPKMAYQQVDALPACGDQTNKSVLDPHAIKIIATDAGKKVGPTGIRLVGAIFCQPLDLVGLSLTYPLMMDHSIFVMGIEARNFQTTSDLSFDGALIFGQLSLFRAKVGGTLFGRETLIQNPQFLNTEIRGALLLRASVILEPVIIDTVTVVGELSLRQSAFPYLLLQFSNIGSVLDLSYSQARCAYQIRKDDIGDLVAVGAGLMNGSQSLAEGNSRTDLSPLFDAGRINSDIPASITQRSVKDAFEDKNCKYNLIAAPNGFVVSDTVVRQRLCLQTLHWPTAPTDADDNQQGSYLTLNDVTVDASAFIDLARGDGGDGSGPDREKRRFEMLGFRTRSLIYNFDTPSYTTSYLNGLQFEQIYSARPARGGPVKCGYDPENTKETKPEFVIDSIDSLKSPLPAPKVADIVSLLTKNTANSTQPYEAFGDVFQKNGEDSTAKQLRIEKANTELENSRKRIFGISTAEDPDTDSNSQPVNNYSTWNRANDFVRLIFGYVLWFLADHGYRPEKVGWFVVGVIVLAFAYFWFWIRIIAIKPEKKPTLLPIGLTFLFDRLLPAYQIRADHYNIESYLKRVKKGHPHGRDFRYMRMTFHVADTDVKTVQRAERALDVLKFIGLILAVFLVAALNSLVGH